MPSDQNSMRVGVLAELSDRENRVAIVPSGVAKLAANSIQVSVESGAGVDAGHSDDDYRSAGATLTQRANIFDTCDFIIQINGPTETELQSQPFSRLSSNHILIALHDPLWRPERAQRLATTGATSIALELIPRITRAQSMDVLSSTATIVGYGATLLAALHCPHLFPMMMTAGGTIRPAKVLVLGAGVAGLQAIATARRLGAVVKGYDIRPAAIEQIESLGAAAIKLELESDSTEDAGGYALKQTANSAQAQRQQLLPYLAECDVAITTAAVPGAESPELITTDMVEAMKPGALIVDLAAERGGNCRLSQPDKAVYHDGVLLLGPTDLASKAAASSSLLFSNNMVALLEHIAKIPLAERDSDEILGQATVASNYELRHPRVRATLGLDPLELSEETTNPTASTTNDTGTEDKT